LCDDFISLQVRVIEDIPVKGDTLMQQGTVNLFYLVPETFLKPDILFFLSFTKKAVLLLIKHIASLSGDMT